ncbi:MAG TPA: TonB family protein [Candidatus Sulfotelmatobacter sp.]|nr:TonB family protein [Candidatus Sulfotelmatobacter sp.]
MRRLWLVLILAVPVLAFATATTPVPRVRPATLAERELVAWRPLTHAAQFADVPHITASPTDCEEVQPPQALTTPSPLMSRTATDAKVKVSFIIGTDGRVHSPLILESAGATGDRSILRTVRTWRYRPATCNGVPTETEGKIEFSSRSK